MRISVVTCETYCDAWLPFSRLFDKFWPENKYDIAFHIGKSWEPWCHVVARVAKEAGDDPILLLLEDYFFNQRVNTRSVEWGLDQLQERGAACVRLYPCPGGIQDYGDPYYAIVPRGTDYRISSQAAIWDPKYLHKICKYCIDTTTAEARDFESRGTPMSDEIPGEVLAWKREIQPWPISYLCSAISRGEWNPDARKLCEANGIETDFSRRAFHS